MSETRKLLRDYGIAVALAVVAAFLIRSQVLEAYRIPSAAMRPTLEPGDTIFVGKLPWLASREIKRGDVVLFRTQGPGARDFVKRVIGVAGDTIQIKNGRLWINGAEARLQLSGDCGQEKLPASATHGLCFEQPALDDYGPGKVPDGHVFVLGDLRTRSLVDTRPGTSWGPIPIATIQGKARWIWLSIEPRGASPSSFFPQFRFERMFRRIE